MTEGLPVADALPALREALRRERIVILTAPPGAGKSTLVPLELRNEPWLGEKRITMLEPRRLAARTVAARMASQIGDPPGGTVGYRIRRESRVSAATRIEVVTEGILTRALLAQPDLGPCGLLIFDEFHERSIHADLGLALARRVQAVFRPDLRILIMSATLDEDALSRALGGAPVVSSAGQSFSVDVSYASDDLNPERDPVPAVAAAIRRTLRAAEGDILAFLPGASEIARVARNLEDLADLDVRPLHGDLPIEAQQAAILPGPRRRVVLATNIAETSLTIEGVRAVVDSGLARVSRFDSGLGLSRLDTVRIARDNADQRAGRAGRLGPGSALRLWTERTHKSLAASRTPEIGDADLLPLALDLAIWGESDASLAWITPPQAGALAEARRILRNLGAMEKEGATAHGRAIHELGVHPRIGHLLIEGRRLGLGGLAADIAALLEERDILGRDAGADLTLRVEALRGRGGAGGSGAGRVREIARDHRSRLKLEAGHSREGGEDVGRLVALAYPERIAQRRAGSTDRYRMATGRGAKLDVADPLTHEEWLAVAHVDARDAEGRIFLAAPLDASTLDPETRDVITWDASRGVIVAQRERRIGELVLDAKPLASVPDDARLVLLAGAIRSEGLLSQLLPDSARSLQRRAASLRAWGRAEAFPDLSDPALLSTLESWLQSDLLSSRSRADLLRVDAAAALTAILDWNQLREVNALAPTHIEAPTGSRIELQYFEDGASPVLAVRLQEIFGWIDTPTVNDGRTRVTLHLLSPARRPVQVTQDLRSFWTNTYPEVRKELRSRYPRHSWPDDPLTAQPIRGPKRRMT